MNRILIGLLLLNTSSAFSDDMLPPPAAQIAELKEFCQEVATEDGTDGKPLKEFLLNCVNDELISEGYRTIKSLD